MHPTDMAQTMFLRLSFVKAHPSPHTHQRRAELWLLLRNTLLELLRLFHPAAAVPEEGTNAYWGYSLQSKLCSHQMEQSLRENKPKE